MRLTKTGMPSKTEIEQRRVVKLVQRILGKKRMRAREIQKKLLEKGERKKYMAVYLMLNKPGRFCKVYEGSKPFYCNVVQS